MHEPLSPIIKKKEHTSLLVISKGLLSTNTGRFIVYCSLINLTTLIAGHFFAPYMLRELKFNYITYTIINSASTLTTLGFMTWWGRRTGRAGSIKILKLTSFMIPFVPIMWLVSGNVSLCKSSPALPGPVSNYPAIFLSMMPLLRRTERVLSPSITPSSSLVSASVHLPAVLSRRTYRLSRGAISFLFFFYPDCLVYWWYFYSCHASPKCVMCLR